MTPLRQRLIREMQMQQFAPRTIDVYVDAVAGLAAFYHRPPDQLQLEEVRSYLHHLLIERKLAQSTCNLRAAAITFFYRVLLGQETFNLRFYRKHSGKLPEVYSAEELVRLFEAAPTRRDRVFLMTTYAAGLRLSEVRHLKPIHIHTERQLIRVEQGKGQKDRYTLLSPQLLVELREYWKEYRPGAWLFSQRGQDGATGSQQCAGNLQEGQASRQAETGSWPTHIASLLCDASTRSGGGSAHDPTASGSQEHQHDDDLSASDTKEARHVAESVRSVASAQG